MPLKAILWTAGVIVAIILVFWLVQSDIWPSGTVAVDKATTGFDAVVGTPGKVLNYIFGGIPTFLVTSVGQNSAMVITIAMFLLIFVTFGDIIETFGTFDRNVSWITAFLIAIVAANLKGIVVVIGAVTGIFAFLGSLAVFVGLGCAFVAFIVVNLGLKGWAPWLMRRKAMMEASKFEYKSSKGVAKIKAAAHGMKEIGDELAS